MNENNQDNYPNQPQDGNTPLTPPPFDTPDGEVPGSQPPQQGFIPPQSLDPNHSYPPPQDQGFAPPQSFDPNTGYPPPQAQGEDPPQQPPQGDFTPPPYPPSDAPAGQPGDMQPPQFYQPDPGFAPPPQEQGYGQQPYMPEYAAPPGYAPPPPPKRSILPKILIPAAVLIVIAILAVALLSSSITKVFMPQQYLAKALINTAANIENGAEMALDLNKFVGTPLEQNLSLTIEEMGYYSSSFEGFNLTLQARTDVGARKFWANASVGLEGMSFNNNQLYISPEMVAFSVPTIYNTHKYITINPGTFTREWNNSDLGLYGGTIPRSFNLQESIDSFFEILDETQKTEAQKTTQTLMDIQEIGENLLSLGTFSNEGVVDILQDDNNEVPVSKMSYFFSAEDMDPAYQSVLAILKTAMIEYYSGALGDAYDREVRESIDEVFEDLENVFFPYGMTVNFYIDKRDLVTRIEIEELTLQVEDYYYGDDVVVSTAITLDMCGEKHLMDNARLHIGFKDHWEESGFLTISQNRTNDADYLNTKIELVAGDEFDQGIIQFTMDWDKKSQERHNMYLEFIVGDDYEDYMVAELSGRLVETDDEISLTNGNLNIYSYGTMDMIASLDYSVKSIPAGDLDLDFSGSVSLFDIPLYELFDAFYDAQLLWML